MKNTIKENKSCRSGQWAVAYRHLTALGRNYSKIVHKLMSFNAITYNLCLVDVSMVDVFRYF